MFGQILSDWARGWWWTPLKETYLKGRLEWEFVSCKSRDYFGGIGPLLLSNGMRGGTMQLPGASVALCLYNCRGERGGALVAPAGIRSRFSTSSSSVKVPLVVNSAQLSPLSSIFNLCLPRLHIDKPFHCKQFKIFVRFCNIWYVSFHVDSLRGFKISDKEGKTLATINLLLSAHAEGAAVSNWPPPTSPRGGRLGHPPVTIWPRHTRAGGGRHKTARSSRHPPAAASETNKPLRVKLTPAGTHSRAQVGFETRSRDQKGTRNEEIETETWKAGETGGEVAAITTLVAQPIIIFCCPTNYNCPATPFLLLFSQDPIICIDQIHIHCLGNLRSLIKLQWHWYLEIKI